MLELPETLILAAQLQKTIKGKTVRRVYPPTKVHKFCWYNGEVSEYNNKVANQKVLSAEAFGIYVELAFENGQKLCINDGVNIRLVKEEEAPKSYQLLIVFTDGEALVFTVAMYGGIILHGGDYDNEYYKKSRGAISPFSKEFEGYYRDLLEKSKDSLSVKAFLATEQRFPGIGNGVLQDIILNAHLHPKRKIGTLTEKEKVKLFNCIISTLHDMIEKSGRDTEKDLFGNMGGYKTMMSKISVKIGCPICKGQITKETYLGGSVYYCGNCQPL